MKPTEHKCVQRAYGDGRVWGVAASQKGTSPPLGWQDPNRGWSSNDTFVKQNLQELLDWVQPDVTWFNHDWAPLKGLLVVP